LKKIRLLKTLKKEFCPRNNKENKMEIVSKTTKDGQPTDTVCFERMLYTPGVYTSLSHPEISFIVFTKGELLALNHKRNFIDTSSNKYWKENNSHFYKANYEVTITFKN
jgi:hypothetical protein